MAGRSRWLVGSSSTNRFDPLLISTASDARVRSPGDSSSAGRRTWSAPRPNLARIERASLGAEPGRVVEPVDQRAAVEELAAGLVELADDHARPEPLRSRREREPAQQRCEERRLARAVGPDDRDALGPRHRHVDRPESEVAPFDDRGRQPGDVVAAAFGTSDGEVELPSLPRLLDHVEPIDGAFGRLRLGGELLGALHVPAADELVVVGGLLRRLALAGDRPLALASGAFGELGLRVAVRLVGLARMAGRRSTRSSRYACQPPPNRVAV